MQCNTMYRNVTIWWWWRQQRWWCLFWVCMYVSSFNKVMATNCIMVQYNESWKV